MVPTFLSSLLPPAESLLSQRGIQGALGRTGLQRAARVCAGTFLQVGPASSYRRCAALGRLRATVRSKACGTRGLSVGDGRGMLALELRGQISGTEAQGAKKDHAGLGRYLREPCVHPSPAALSSLQLTASEEEFLRTYAGVVSSQLSQLPQHSIDQGESRARAPAIPSQGHPVVVSLEA